MLLLPFIFLLCISELSFARPIPSEKSHEGKKGISIPWRRVIPPLGAVALLGSLAGIVYLGTKADEAYASLKTIDESEATAKYLSLPTNDQRYMEHRLEYIGRTLGPEEKAMLTKLDEEHGWPTMEMPDTAKMNEEDRRMLQNVYGKLKHAIDKVKKTDESTVKAIFNAEAAKAERREARYHAALIAATDWKEALERVQGEISVR